MHYNNYNSKRYLTLEFIFKGIYICSILISFFNQIQFELIFFKNFLQIQINMFNFILKYQSKSIDEFEVV